MSGYVRVLDSFNKCLHDQITVYIVLHALVLYFCSIVAMSAITLHSKCNKSHDNL